MMPLAPLCSEFNDLLQSLHYNTVLKIDVTPHVAVTLQHTVRQLYRELSPRGAGAYQYSFHNTTNNAPENMAVIHMDFSENFTCVSQYETQSAHWYIPQVVSLPVVSKFDL